MNDRLFCCQFFQPKADQPQADKVRRSSRSDSLFLMLSRLSYFFLPRTVAIKTFILTLLLYIERGTIVNPLSSPQRFPSPISPFSRSWRQARLGSKRSGVFLA